MKKVLSTKTLNKEAIAYARRSDIDLRCLDLIETNAALKNNIPIADSAFDALVFTSSNAVKYFLLQSQALMLMKSNPVFSLQGKTQNELTQIGIEPTLTATNAMLLANVIIDQRSVTSVLHVCGDMKLDVLEDKLSAANITYEPFIVYTTTLKPTKISEQFDGIMFYSPSGVESFFTNNQISTNTVCCCIGDTTATAVKEKDNKTVVLIPAQASPVAMIDAMTAHFNNTLK